MIFNEWIYSSSLRIKEEKMLNSSLINIVSNMTDNKEVHEQFESVRLSAEDVIEDLSGFSQNGDRSGSDILDSVMPLETFGECATLGLTKNIYNIANIR